MHALDNLEILLYMETEHLDTWSYFSHTLNLCVSRWQAGLMALSIFVVLVGYLIKCMTEVQP
jgi:hypothetical protein